jgi:hypothetical protein
VSDYLHESATKPAPGTAQNIPKNIPRDVPAAAKRAQGGGWCGEDQAGDGGKDRGVA